MSKNWMNNEVDRNKAAYTCGYNKAIDDFTKWYEDHEHKRGFPYTIGNIKTCLSSDGIVREFKIAKQKAGDVD